MDRNKTAILLGASGLVGSFLLNRLIESDAYSKIIIFVRSSLNINHPKLKEYVVDFDDTASYEELVKGDDLFCCLGTTIDKAGSQEAFRKVDYEYPVSFAQIAVKNGVKQYLLVSSIGADSGSSIFYLRTKGECEEGILRSGIASASVFRPASLSGNRKEFRLGERLSLPILKLFSFLLVGKLRKYRPIEAAQVAKAMCEVAQHPKAGFTIYESDEIQRI